VGVGLYLSNVLLIRSYVIKRAPELANDLTLEMTAGTGIVPKWVSFFGLLTVPAFIAAGIWFFEWYWPK
jgi:nucleoside-specific outer membrane channel protein Tsx